MQWQLQVDDSLDPVLSGVVVGKAGRKWSSSQAKDDALSSLMWKEMCRGQSSRVGLGVKKHVLLSKLRGKDRRRAVVDEVRNQDAARGNVRLHTLSQQGRSTTWEGTDNRDISWKRLTSSRKSRLSFLVGSVYDTLPSQTNLARWGRAEDATCRLCGDRRESLDHVLAGCSVALGGGRYRFRHDRVLSSLRDILFQQVERAKSLQDSGPGHIAFIKAGRRPPAQKARYAPRSVLAGTADWVVRVDLDRSLVFPSHIAETRLRPDIVLWSDSQQQVIIGELTVPLERNILDAHERKK